MQTSINEKIDWICDQIKSIAASVICDETATRKEIDVAFRRIVDLSNDIKCYLIEKME